MSAPPRASRTAFSAIAGTFAVNGLVYSSLLPRLPEIRDAVGAGEAEFGFALLGMGLGGLLGSALAPRLLRLRGTAAGTVAGGAVLAVAGIAPALASQLGVLFAAFIAVGVSDAVHDIGMNHLLMGVPSRRSVASRMHALWSIGALVATGLGALAAALGVPVATQMMTVAVVGVAAQAALARGLRVAGTLRPVPVPAEAPAPVAGSGRRRAVAHGLVLLAAAAIAAAFVENGTLEWSAITLRDGLGATVGVAGLGPAVFNATMVLGRLGGDAVIDRLGAARTARLAGGWVAVSVAAALLAARATGAPVVALVGFAAAGLGAAVTFPLLFVAGERVDPSGSGRGAATVSGLARVGFLVTPPLVGVVAEATSLVLAMLVVPVGGVLTAVVLPRVLDRSGR